MFILDSDHISIIQLQTPPGFQTLSQRMVQHNQSDFFVTIVSFHEQILGWNSYMLVRRTRREHHVRTSGEG